jgi:signal transduction histidine kinase
MTLVPHKAPTRRRRPSGRAGFAVRPSEMTGRPAGSLVPATEAQIVLADEAAGGGRRYLGIVDRVVAFARRRFGDAVFIALGIGAEIEIAVTSVHIDKLPAALLAPFWALPLLLRRRFPIGAPTFALIAIATHVVIDPKGNNNLSFPFFSALAAAFTFGFIAERRKALAGLGISVAVVTFVSTQLPNRSVGNTVWPLVLFGAVWTAGYFLATRSQQIAEAAARAEAAERAREEEARAAVAEERARIARELHDVVGHAVSVMTVQASAARRLLKPEQEREREALMVVEQTGREALAEMRRLVGVLRRPEEAPALAPQPSLEHVDRLVAQTREAGLPVKLRVEGQPVTLPAGVDLTAYRLVQEGLTNAVKHARADRAEVLVRYGDGDVEITVSDDGRGGGDGDGSGHGLVGMRERVSVYGGELEAGPRNGGGFVLRARLPVR